MSLDVKSCRPAGGLDDVRTKRSDLEAEHHRAKRSCLGLSLGRMLFFLKCRRWPVRGRIRLAADRTGFPEATSRCRSDRSVRSVCCGALSAAVESGSALSSTTRRSAGRRLPKVAPDVLSPPQCGGSVTGQPRRVAASRSVLAPGARGLRHELPKAELHDGPP